MAAMSQEFCLVLQTPSLQTQEHLATVRLRILTSGRIFLIEINSIILGDFFLFLELVDLL